MFARACLSAFPLVLALPVDAQHEQEKDLSSKQREALRKQAEGGDPDAQVALATMHAKAGDHAEAARWYREAAEQGQAEAQYQVASLCLDGRGVPRDLETGLAWARKSAEQGYAQAQHLLGLLSASGQGMKRDQKAALEWHRKAAVQGLEEAQMSLGAAYLHGRGVRKDPAVALEWYRKAAQQESALAFQALGQLHLFGVTRDKKKAAEYIKEAAELGLVDAQRSIALSYSAGEGMHKDLVTGYAWMLVSGTMGNTRGAPAERMLVEQLTAAQITKARKLSRELIARVRARIEKAEAAAEQRAQDREARRRKAASKGK